MTGLFMQPDCAELLFRQGLRSFGDFFRFAEGEVIGGHHARNVARVNIAGLRGFLGGPVVDAHPVHGSGLPPAVGRVGFVEVGPPQTAGVR